MSRGERGRHRDEKEQSVPCCHSFVGGAAMKGRARVVSKAGAIGETGAFCILHNM